MDPLAVEMDTILAYARLTEDFNPLHVDPAFAAATPMGGVIAHGTMSLALALMAAVEAHMGEGDILELDVRFVAPVRVGDSVRAVLRDATVPGVGGTSREVAVEGSDGGERIAGTLRVLPGSAG